LDRAVHIAAASGIESGNVSPSVNLGRYLVEVYAHGLEGPTTGHSEAGERLLELAAWSCCLVVGSYDTENGHHVGAAE
jgi:hypothetical protein